MSEVPLYRPEGKKKFSNVERFRGGLVFKAHRLVYQSTLGSRVINKKHSPTSHAVGLPRTL